jgi:uncharacterized membrane protein
LLRGYSICAGILDSGIDSEKIQALEYLKNNQIKTIRRTLMTKKINTSNQDKLAAKKAVVLGTRKKKQYPLAMAVVAVFIIAAVVVFFNAQGGGDSPVTANGPAVIDKTLVVFPTHLFEDGRARHFEYVSGENTIRYFVLKSSDGVLRTAFDACDVCWPAGKGYYQDGDHMVCRNCGRRFASVLVNEVQGGCNPAPLSRKLENDNLVIQIKDIEQGRQYFNFAGKVSS